jgi:hypothetical protein
MEVTRNNHETTARKVARVETLTATQNRAAFTKYKSTLMGPIAFARQRETLPFTAGFYHMWRVDFKDNVLAEGQKCPHIFYP